MAIFLKTDKDPEGKGLRVDGGFRAKNGTCFLLLTRLPPHYPKPPAFIVELSSDPIELRSGEHSAVYHKAYAFQDFSAKELKFLREANAGNASLPLFGSGYSTISRAMGKSFYKFTESELAAIIQADRMWKLVGGQR